MALEFTDKLHVGITPVANEFIDQFMVAANGEYVKVYLYLLRHGNQSIELSTIADALNHTEADVKRALAYWQRMGVLCLSDSREKAAASRVEDLESGQVQEQAQGKDQQPRLTYSSEDLLRLRQNDDFAQLLYIAQKYMNKAFTPKDCEVFAYLYEGLKMSVELLEYLVEYCAQNGHTSIRYIEKVALNWHEKGFTTVDAAKGYSESFMKDAYGVMRAFGLTERSPGDSEKAMIETWFKTYGFTKELVIEACNRTLEATHKPSFQYADKILSEWKKNSVKSLRDVQALDQKRQNSGKAPVKKTASNQFHNFNQRDTDYDALILQGLKE